MRAWWRSVLLALCLLPAGCVIYPGPYDADSGRYVYDDYDYGYDDRDYGVLYGYRHDPFDVAWRYDPWYRLYWGWSYYDHAPWRSGWFGFHHGYAYHPWYGYGWSAWDAWWWPHWGYARPYYDRHPDHRPHWQDSGRADRVDARQAVTERPLRGLPPSWQSRPLSRGMDGGADTPLRGPAERMPASSRPAMPATPGRQSLPAGPRPGSSLPSARPAMPPATRPPSVRPRDGGGSSTRPAPMRPAAPMVNPVRSSPGRQSMPARSMPARSMPASSGRSGPAATQARERDHD